VRKIDRTPQEGSAALIATADEIAAVHLMLDRHSVPRDHAEQELSLQGRIQEFAFMAAAGAVKVQVKAGCHGTAPTQAQPPPPSVSPASAPPASSAAHRRRRCRSGCTSCVAQNVGNGASSAQGAALMIASWWHR
jgi:hypothetical protein